VTKHKKLFLKKVTLLDLDHSRLINLAGGATTPTACIPETCVRPITCACAPTDPFTCSPPVSCASCEVTC